MYKEVPGIYGLFRFLVFRSIFNLSGMLGVLLCISGITAMILGFGSFIVWAPTALVTLLVDSPEMKTEIFSMFPYVLQYMLGGFLGILMYFLTLVCAILCNKTEFPDYTENPYTKKARTPVKNRSGS